jgi:hypothetical protein
VFFLEERMATPCTFVYDTVEDRAASVLEFIEGNRANEQAWPGWCDSILTSLRVLGYAVTDDGNGCKRVLLNTPGRTLRLTPIRPANVPDTNV